MKFFQLDRYRVFIGIWVILIFNIFFCSISKGTLPFNATLVNITRLLFPQGWSFFTKDPTEYNYDIYRIEETGDLELINQRHTDKSNYWGFSRISRSIGREVSILLNFTDFAKEKWKKNKGPVFKPQDLAEINVIIPKKDDRIKYLTAGKYLIVKYGYIPIEWINAHQEKYMPWEGLLLKIS